MRNQGMGYDHLARIARPSPAHIAAIAAATAARASGIEYSSAMAATAICVSIAVMVGFAANDIYDVDKDRLAGRDDKPLATGQLSFDTVIAFIGVLVAVGLTVAVL